MVKSDEKYYRLFRVMLDRDEQSERSFSITALILKIKPNNYYALMLRKAYFYSLP